MPRKAKQAQDSGADQTATLNSGNNATNQKGESVAGYFRKVFKKNPKLLMERSNEPLFRRWLDDHPDQTEVPQSVKTSLQNIKGVLRRKALERKARQAAEAEAAEDRTAVRKEPPQPRSASGLELLEQQIDECLAFAKGIDREQLEHVIGHLRLARNLIVRKLNE
jgi:hypothetical protein